MRAVRHPAFEDRLVMSRNRPGRRARAPPRPCRSRRSSPCGTGCPWHSSRRARYSPALRGRPMEATIDVVPRRVRVSVFRGCPFHRDTRYWHGEQVMNNRSRKPVGECRRLSFAARTACQTIRGGALVQVMECLSRARRRRFRRRGAMFQSVASGASIMDRTAEDDWSVGS